MELKRQLPNGWGCCCRVRALSEAALQRRGLEVSSSQGRLDPVEQSAGVNVLTGEPVMRQGVRWTDPATGERLMRWPSTAPQELIDALSLSPNLQ